MQGDWEQDQRTGRGKVTYPDGKVYQGQFKAGVRHGEGEEISTTTNKKRAGTWVDGKLTSSGRKPAPK